MYKGTKNIITDQSFEIFFIFPNYFKRKKGLIIFSGLAYEY